jgi:membrane-bound metal-dependent hydrolase YbcI (DUF457 family)
MAKTHLAIGIFAMAFFLPYVNHKLIFIPVVLIASILPDIDSGFSTFGKKGLFRPLQVLSKHRGLFHSFTLCIGVSIVFALYLPVLAFAFFLGYALHLLADSWTVEGIKPFWPFKPILKGAVRVGGIVEETVFIVFAILDVIFLVLLFL